jgi:hypothetical protein
MEWMKTYAIAVRISIGLIFFALLCHLTPHKANANTIVDSFCGNDASDRGKGLDFQTGNDQSRPTNRVGVVESSGAIIMLDACARNQMCIRPDSAQRVSRSTSIGVNTAPPSKQAACYPYCECAYGKNLQGAFADSGTYVKSSTGYEINSPNQKGRWGYYCGNVDTFPDKFSEKIGGALGFLGNEALHFSEIKQPPNINGAPAVCLQTQNQGIIDFIPVRGGQDCTCDENNKQGGMFTCTFGGKVSSPGPENRRSCGTTEICDNSITWGWPCRAPGSAPRKAPTPTPSPTPFPTLAPSETTCELGKFSPCTRLGYSCVDNICVTPTPPVFNIPGSFQILPTGTIQNPCRGGVCPTALGNIETDPTQFIGSIMGILLSLAGTIAMIIIIFSGYEMMISRGNDEKLKEAKERLTSAIIGLVFVIFSVALLQVITVDILGIPGFGR